VRTRVPRNGSRGAGGGNPPECLLHPALDRPGSARGPQRSVLNLSGEVPILRFSIGLFSSLAFLEAQGWPWTPWPEGWALGEDGLPRWAAEPRQESMDPPAEGHAALIRRLLAGRAPGPTGRGAGLPRRLRLYGRWREWLERSRPEEGLAASCRGLLLDLVEMAAALGPEALPPGRWGVGVVWRPAADLRLPGFRVYRAESGVDRMGAIQAALDPEGEGRTLTPVLLEGVAPYAFAGLEPLLVSRIGSLEGAREWMRSALRDGPKGLTESLARVLAEESGGGWILAGEVLDSQSQKALESAARSAARAVVVLHPTEGRPAGRTEGIRFLWLTPTGEEWYVRHASACLGPSPDDLLRVLGRAGFPAPRCGEPLVPPLDLLPEHPAVPVWGGLGSTDQPRTAGQSEADLLRAGALPALLGRARRWDHRGEPEVARFWQGVALLMAGQPSQALERWEEMKRPERARLGVPYWRARALERLQDFQGLAKAVEAAKKDADLPRELLPALANLEGQVLWLRGDREKAESVLLRLAKEASDPDLRATTLCVLATVRLFASDADGALDFLHRAEEAAGESPPPAIRFLLNHRWGLLKQKLGDVEGARTHFERALETAASVGFRAHEASALCDLGNALRRLQRQAEAAAAYERAADGGRALGLKVLTAYARFNGAICRLEEGHPLEALTIFQGALQEDLAARNVVAASLDAFWCTLALQHLGRYPEALEAAERGLSQLDKVSEPEVLHDLLVVLGDLLLLTGQEGRLRHIVDRLRETPWPDLEADDRIMEAAVRSAAARRGIGTFTSSERKKALALLKTATSCGRAFWHLLSAGPGTGAKGDLECAWAEARASGSDHLSCRVLMAMARAGTLPRLDPETRERLRSYLERNRIRGPERDLFSLLDPPLNRPPAPEEPPVSELALLASAESGEEGALERLAGYLGGPVCLGCPGEMPSFAGDPDPDGRRALLAARGRTGPVQEDGTTVVGAQDPSGRWVGCASRPGRYMPAETETLLRLWLRLLPVRRPAPHGAPPVFPKAFEGLLLTRSPAMAPALDLLARAAPFSFPVLLTGEPGTGKEIFAQALHVASPRGRKAWVPANCANLSPTLAASLLFGHRKGAFTGADRDQSGLVEAARDSTLFLDEVGELPAEVQASLLRFLQDGSFLPVGEVRPRHSNARIVAATNRDLEEAVARGAFRADLLHRLNVIRVEIPPLRRRPEDVALLFEHFLTRAADAERVPRPPVDPEVLSRLEAYRWPGNVRELQNVARALLVASQGEDRIRTRHLPARLSEEGTPVAGDGLSLAHALRRAESAAIRAALDASGGSPSEAARRLGISRQGLFEKMRRLGIRSEPR